MTSKEFELLVDKTSDSIYNVVHFMIRDEAESRDIVQETFIKFWENSNLHEFENPQGYLMKMAKNLTIDKIRRNKTKEKAVKELSLHADSTEAEVDKNLENKKRMKTVLNFINTLKEKQREVFILREIEGLTYNEISNYLEISEDQVKVTLHRVRNSIRKQFSSTQIL